MNEEMKGRLLCYEAPFARVLGSYNDSVIARLILQGRNCTPRGEC